jgi:4-amino-4-deoxychorismate lyase
MYPFFETIRYKNGILENVSYHQARINRTLRALGGNTPIQLDKIQLVQDFEKDIVYKIKCLYNLEGALHIEKEIYNKKIIKNVSIHLAAQEEYQFKYTDRTWLNEALKKRGTDEIIIVQNNIIKDGNYANLVLFNGIEWHTPKNPLLLGTQRTRLIDENKIIEKVITLSDLANYTTLKYINAMMLWEESPEIEIGQIVHS